MRFLLLLCADETTPVPDVLPGCTEWSAALTARNALVTTMGLHPPETASTLRVRGGEVLMTDGPFAETKEQMGGLALIEAESAGEARRIAATHPWARFGAIEVRQVF
ncbi:YciI family protein [Actinophytocola glycyrrhizae]|uniref:YciI family protein n=1 Tax=Actinophytocola glycyrrhizae TaxID=2044873 RepID=A0ABV9RXU1_9PSEU